MSRKDVLAVVLGGGRGTRLYPLTKLRTKPAIPIGGKYRLLDVPISNAINSGITRIFVLTQFLPASLHRHVHMTYQFDIFSDGYVEILPPEQTLTCANWYKGTADAVRCQMPRILSRSPKNILILAGDHLYRMDYGELIDFHRRKKADITIAVLPISVEDAPRYGILKTENGGRIVAFHEKPRDPEVLAELESWPGAPKPYLASMGLYLFRTEVLTQLLGGNGGDDFGRHIIPIAIESQRVYAYPFEGYWEDIGTISTFYEANLALTHPDPAFDFADPNQPIYTRCRFLPASRIDGCRLDRAVVAEGCKLYDAEIEECVIGLRSIVLPRAQLRRVVMMGADHYETDAQKTENQRLGRPHIGIGEGARIERAIIDKNARIGRGAVIHSHAGEVDRDEELYSIRDGIVVIPKNATILEGMAI